MIREDIDMEVYCCECSEKVEAIKTTGEKVYPHRKDLYNLVFWECPHCNNFVGTHKNSKNNAPLGCICGKELKQAKMKIHDILDPLWENKTYKRTELYKIISDKIGWKYHTAMIKTIEEAREIYKIILDIKKVGRYDK